jgi:hypothetical protein
MQESDRSLKFHSTKTFHNIYDKFQLVDFPFSLMKADAQRRHSPFSYSLKRKLKARPAFKHSIGFRIKIV